MANPIFVSTNESKIVAVTKLLLDAAPGYTYLNMFKEMSVADAATLMANYVSSSTAQLSTTMAANIGLTGSNATTAAAYFKAALDQAGANRGAAIVDLVGAIVGLQNDTTWGATANAFVTSVNTAYVYSKNSANTTTDLATLKLADEQGTSSFSGMLTAGRDNLVGTSGADKFYAYILDNANTLQSGDMVDGGVGSDTLFADIGTSQSFAITPHTASVETIEIRAQALDADASDNNISNTDVQSSQIDAQRMKDVTNWVDTNSRADLIIEDVRINDSQITRDITITMRETDPGHVDYGLYFDQNSLRTQSNKTDSLTIELADTRSLAQSGAALKDNPYWGFNLMVDGTQQSITSEAIDAAQTYAELLVAVNAAIEANPAVKGKITAALGTPVTRTDTISGQPVQVTPLVLSSTTATLGVPAGQTWLAQNGVPASSGLHTLMNLGQVVSTDLVTSKVVLDYVGRGSTGGDLVIGGLSVGDTSTSKGVQRFEITVEDDSALQTINSTNNTLMEVTIVNGAQSRVSDAYKPIDAAGGYLKVNGTVGNPAAGTGINEALPGSDNQHNAFGFSDVRLIDGSSMTGKLEFTAEITNRSIAKYLNLADTQANPAQEDVTFTYSGGSNNDVMNVVIDSTTVASNVSGQPDFFFKLNGGSGNDTITVDIATAANTETAEWLADQRQNKNITIDGGAGNDTIMTPGAGDINILAGDGNDVVYTDNSGTIATKWVVNSNNAGLAAATVTTNSDNLQHDGNGTTGFLYKGKLTVTFSGAGTDLSGGVTAGAADSVANAYTNGFEKVVDIPTGANYAVTQKHVNQAIKDAINNDAVLKTVLKATDGPANTLVITSLVDGDFNINDLSMTVSSADLTSYQPTEQALILAAYKEFAKSSLATINDANTANAATVTAGNLVNGMTNGMTAADTVMGQDAGVRSGEESDNTINLGAGDDVLILGTGANSNDTIVLTGYNQGKDTIINFSDAGTDRDGLSFASYLVSKASASGSATTQATIGTTLQVNDPTANANEITVLTGMGFNTTTATFSGLTADRLLAAVNSTNTAGTANYGNITEATLNANNTYTNLATASTLVGGDGRAVVMIENNLNEGEYHVFELKFDGLSTNANRNFSSAQYIATLDFGNSLDFATAGVALANGKATAGVGGVGAMTYAVVPAAASVNEGSNAVFNVTTTGVADGVYAYTLGGTVNAADVTGGLSGNVTITAGKGTITAALIADATTEGNETITATIGGVTSTAVTVVDTSVAGGGSIIPVVAAGVAGTAAADVFTIDAATALADAAGTNFQPTITGFATGDSLRIDMPTANAAITTLAQLDGQQGVSVQSDPFTGSTLINLGNDANGGEVVTITLAGVADAATVAVQIV